MKQVDLSNSLKKLLVDDEDYERVRIFTWSVTGNYQIHAWAYGEEVKIANFIMQSHHRYDHKDRNSFNNQKSNLRICTQQENRMNSTKSKNKSSKYKGVHYCVRDQVWRAKIMIDRKTICLGTFHSEIAAARAYNKKAEKLFGEFANLNEV